MVETNDKEVLQKMVNALTGLSNVTLKMIEEQREYVVSIAELAPEFDEASKKPEFWTKAARGLQPADVATFFIVMGKLGEVSNRLSKFATLEKGARRSDFAVQRGYKDA